MSNANGNGFATWSQRTDSSTGSGATAIHRVVAVRFATASVTWGLPKIIQGVMRNSYQTEIGVDGFGLAIVLWPQDSTTTAVTQLRSERLSPQ